MSRWVIIGAGYTGARVVAAARARGDDAIGTRRAAQPPWEPLDVTRPGELERVLASGDRVIVTAPPADGSGTGERAVARAAAAALAARIVYVSSTGVYAPAAGAWVDEGFAIAPLAATGRARVAAEAAIASGATPTVILRVAGIYGPDRGAVARLRAGSYRVIGDGRAHVSRIHVDDLVTAIVAAATAAAPSAVYNVADDDPCPAAELADDAARALGLPPPPRVPLTAVDADTAAMFTADRRIANGRLRRELGWTPRFPSWRTALAADLSWC